MIHFSSLFAYSPMASLKATCALIKLKLTPQGFIDITAEDLLTRMQSDKPLTIIDCRRPETFTKIGHIQGAKNYPIMKFDEECHAIPKDTQIAVVCYFGLFCRIASQKLADLGHKDVLSMKGGMEEWIMSDKPITKTNPMN